MLNSKIVLASLVLFLPLQLKANKFDSICKHLSTNFSFAERMEGYIREVYKYKNVDNRLAYNLSITTVEHARNSGDEKTTLRCRIIEGECLISLGYHKLGLEQFTYVLFKAREIRANELLAEVYYQRGTFYREAGLYDKMRADYQRLKSVVLANKLNSHIAKMLNALGIMDTLVGNLSAAEDKFRRVLNLPDLEAKFRVMVLNNIGDIKRSMNELDSALDYYNLNYQLAKELSFRKGLVDICLNISGIHRLKKDFDRAIEYSDQSLDNARSIQWRDGEADAIKNLAQINYDKGEYKRAYNLLEKYQEIRLDQFKSNFAQNIVVLESQYILERNNKLKADSELKKLQSRTKSLDLRILIWFIGIIVLLIVSFVILYGRRINRTTKEYRTTKVDLEARLSNKQKELKLRSQQLSKTYSLLREMLETTKSLGKKIPDSSLYVEELHEKFQIVEKEINRESDWNEFIETFRDSLPNFEDDLIRRFPELSNNEMILCVYIKSGLTQREIAEKRNISLEGVKTGVKRLKKKLSIANELSLFDFLNRF